MHVQPGFQPWKLMLIGGEHQMDSEGVDYVAVVV